MIIKAKNTLNLMAERRKGAALNKSSVSIMNGNEEELDNSFLNKSSLEMNKSSLESSKLTSSKLVVN
jgi:hypothetical protein